MDVQGHRAVYSFGGYETLISLLKDRMDGVTDNSSFLEAYFMKPKEEDFSDSEIVIGRGALLYSKEDRYEGMDAEISIDTVRFNRKDGEYSAILNKINAVIAQYTEGNYEYGRSEPGVLYYQYEICDVIIAKDYISVSGYLTGYVAGGGHGWGSARSWAFPRNWTPLPAWAWRSPS